MNKHFIILFLTLISISGFTQHKAAYQLFDGEGNAVTYADLILKSQEADVVLFGEYHTNPIVHWLQYELVKDLANETKNGIVLGAEMFEADNQIILNEYLSGTITEKTFNSEMRLWDNYTTDYKPIVEFSKERAIHFVATNVPRRYANMVYMNGFEALDDIDKNAENWLAPIPIKYNKNLKTYQAILEMAGGHGGENLPKAQAIKDATMAYFITENRIKETVFIHLNGAYHSDDYEGIGWYLSQEKKAPKVFTISTVSQKDVTVLENENKNKADIIIVVAETMTQTMR